MDWSLPARMGSDSHTMKCFYLVDVTVWFWPPHWFSLFLKSLPDLQCTQGLYSAVHCAPNMNRFQPVSLVDLGCRSQRILLRRNFRIQIFFYCAVSSGELVSNHKNRQSHEVVLPSFAAFNVHNCWWKLVLKLLSASSHLPSKFLLCCQLLMKV